MPWCRLRDRFPVGFSHVAVVTGVLMMAGSASAQTNRYQSWSPPQAAQIREPGVPALLKDLKALVDEAETARAADRVFLQDLRDLMARYQGPNQASNQGPVSQRLLFDDFSDGDLTRNPGWTVVSGEYWVEQGYGLRSRTADPVATQTTTAKVSKEELAISILGAILQGSNSSKTTPTAEPKPPAPATPDAVLRTRVRMANAFTLTSTFSSWTATGSFAFAVTQGRDLNGYRVIYTPRQGARGATAKLLRTTARGDSTIDTASLNGLEDQKQHSLQWVRGKDGRMTVNLDGKTILRAQDTSFRAAFDGLALINTGADVIVGSIVLEGVKN